MWYIIIDLAFILYNLIQPTKNIIMKKVYTSIGIILSFTCINAQIVINEIYTGGGALGAAITNDFIELKNIGSTPTTLSGATLQYADANGAFTYYYSIPSITLGPNQHYLIQQGGDNLGGVINLINPNLTVNVVLGFDGSTNVGVGVGLALTSGKVALASNSTQVSSPISSNVLDFVGYGNVNQYEGSAAAPSPTILNSISRTSGDTNSNSEDFTTTLPSPQSAGTLAVKDITNGTIRNNFIKNTLVKTDEIIFESEVKNVRIYSASGVLMKSSLLGNIERLNIGELAKGNYIVVGISNNKEFSAKILKD
ncbi:lamin tail domain-containing protein [Chryseobacterium sp.]|uniref:lamin tail domain-containing protein n=1 Tax=Chryseobacterium sp. TaxID=1871047 RepID=UPI00289FFD04|nr:lamin tail domain-containing protein [Chryseobacterium sp.]